MVIAISVHAGAESALSSDASQDHLIAAPPRIWTRAFWERAENRGDVSTLCPGVDRRAPRFVGRVVVEWIVTTAFNAFSTFER